jgi:CO/xanthine dehydrogenase FAD-binding subunit
MSCRIEPATRLHSISPFEYFVPNSAAEALSMLRKLGDGAKVIAGGTDLVPLLKLRRVSCQYLVDISRVKELEFVKPSARFLRIGALTKHSAIERSSLVREMAFLLAEAAGQLGSPQIRNMGTVGGNLANASPCSDTATPLLALGAKLKLIGSSGERIVPLDDFFLGVNHTALRHDELLAEALVPVQPPGAGSSFIKIGRRLGPDLALVSVAAKVTMEKDVCRDARIALGSVAPTPVRAKKCEATLRGRTLEDKVIDEASQIASEEIRPISDVRASMEYRRDVSKVMVSFAIRKALSRRFGCNGGA